jgi:lipoprotein-releasing system permease protein
MLGIMLGVMALITVMSVMNGFHKEVRDRILGMASHATISAVDGPLYEWQQIMEQSKKHLRVIGQAPFVEVQAMLTSGENVSGAIIRGVVSEHEKKVSDVEEHMRVGSLSKLEPGKFRIILGRELATVLNVVVGDEVTVVTPKVSHTIAGALPRLENFTVAGVFEVGMGEYDRGIALVHMQDAAKLLRMGEGVTGVRLKLDDLFLAPQVSHELAYQLPGAYRVTDWTMHHRNFFSALQTEKRMMGLILFLIVAVAAFNIVSTLVMVVTDKQSDIAILRTLGASPRSIMGIFIVQGATIGFVGTIAGIISGILLSLNIESLVKSIEQAFNVDFLDPNIYYISELPSDMHFSDITMVSITAFLITLLATIYPAWRASRIHPAEALRYE